MAVTVPAPTDIFGLKVVNASCSVTWGGQGGTLQLTLVEDGSSPDFPELGTACAFSFGAFYFAGIFQRQMYKDDLGGRTYDVVLESPAKILDGAQVIIDRFDGIGASVAGGNIPVPQYFTPGLHPHTNIFNVFGSYESADFVGGHFGLSNVNSAGMELSKLLPRLQALTQGAGPFGTSIKYGNTTYKLDLSEVTARMPGYLRISGPVQSINAILGECAEFAQFDYFVSIQGAGGLAANGAISDAVLVVHVVDKQSNPSTGVVENFVQTTRSAGKLISGSYGAELSDATTQKVVVGGPASRYHVGTFDFSIPIWGKLADGTLLTGRANPAGGGAQQVAATSPVVFNNTQPMDIFSFIGGTSSGVPISIDTFNPPSYIASLAEIRAALGGIEVWSTFKMFETLLGKELNGFVDPASVPWVGTIEANKEWLGLLGSGTLLPMDLSATSAATANKAYAKDKADQNQRLFNAVSRAASEFYLKKFLVPLPFEGGGILNNRKFLSEDFTYVNSWEIADSAQWTYQKPFNDVSFYDASGRLKSVCTWPRSSFADYSVLGSDYAIALDTGHVATTKGGPEGEIYWFRNPGGPFASGAALIPFVVFDCGAQIQLFDGLTTPDFGLTILASYLANEYIPPQNYIYTGKQGVQFAFPPDVMRPSFFGIPQQSPRYNYGPWYKFVNDRGKADVTFEEDIVPENFASFSDFNQAGFALVETGSTDVTSTESGYVEVADIPQYNIAQKFAGSGPYVTSMDISVGTDGVTTNYQFSTWTPNFGKLARYNIDRLQRINKAMIAYLQRNRQRITKRPFPKIPFEKGIFEKIEPPKRYGRQDMGLINFTFKSLGN